MSKLGLIIQLFIFCGLTANLAFAVSDKEDFERRVFYKEKCREIKKYSVGTSFSVDCFHNYHHYNSKSHSYNYSATEALSRKQLKVAEYNLWHPGSLRSGFKDIPFVAKIMNRWDVIAATELLPVIGRDEENNNQVVDFLEEGPKLLSELEKTDGNEEQIKELKENIELAKKLYRAPGYLKILYELRKLDRTWSLILAPRGEASSPTHVQEMVGFYYRASVVKPKVNEHCDEFKTNYDGIAFACIPNLKKEFMGRDVRPVFSRRPFLANFESGNFDFTMITSHVIFTSPDEEDKMAEILMPSFGVKTYEDIGTGVTKETYARVAETKIILEFMNKLREYYYEEDIIYGGDMNLNYANNFWPDLMEELPGSKLFINAETTISQPRFLSSGTPTNGVSNDFDHFIFDTKKSHECMKSSKDTTEIHSYYKGSIYKYIKDEYLIRDPAEVVIDAIVEDIFGSEEDDDKDEFDYSMIPGAKIKMEKKIDAYEKELKMLKTIKNGKVVWDDYRFKEKMSFYKRRVFTDQLRNRFYYRVYSELISDHFPISMSCKNTSSDDDND